MQSRENQKVINIFLSRIFIILVIHSKKLLPQEAHRLGAHVGGLKMPDLITLHLPSL